MRKSNLFLFFLAGQIVLLGLAFVHADHRRQADSPLVDERRAIVRNLGLTDLCLFTEASYTRHLTQADIHTPFLDHPFCLEHFPSGSILMPPEIVKRVNAKLD